MRVCVVCVCVLVWHCLALRFGFLVAWRDGIELSRATQCVMKTEEEMKAKAQAL